MHTKTTLAVGTLATMVYLSTYSREGSWNLSLRPVPIAEVRPNPPEIRKLWGGGIIPQIPYMIRHTQLTSVVEYSLPQSVVQVVWKLVSEVSISHLLT